MKRSEGLFVRHTKECVGRADLGLVARRLTVGIIISVGLLLSNVSNVMAADKAQKLTGAQIIASFTGKELTDEAHWGEVYRKDAKVITDFEGHKTVGAWHVKADKLCLNFPKGSNEISGCYEVWRNGRTVELRETGQVSGLEGVLRRPVKGE